MGVFLDRVHAAIGHIPIVGCLDLSIGSAKWVVGGELRAVAAHEVG